jgi:asparagine synthase (glutamine-hydrolysing)
MWNDDKTICLVYNGELWNSLPTAELRNKLTNLKTTSDTELILKAYEEWGPDYFKEFDGMFSFAILDTRVNLIFVVRDVLGELPLWYGIDNDGKLYFSSEKKGLPLENLYKKQVKLIQPGNYIQYNYFTLEHKFVNYSNIETFYIADERLNLIANIRYQIEKGVEVKIPNDVPFCTLLSGGIDSVITTYLLSKKFPNIEAFVVAMGDEDKDDLKWARIAAKEFGIKLNEVIISEDDVRNGLDETLYAIEMDRWQNVASAVAGIKLSKVISDKGYKVVFSGDLSDELWGSYGHIQRWHYKPEDYNEQRWKLLYGCSKTNFLSVNQSMLWGGTIEVRTPFSWKPFVEYAMNIPPYYQTERGHMKPLLREAFSGEISDELLWRQKSYFAEGCRTADIVKKVKDTLENKLNQQFKYKDDINYSKFFG